MITAQECMQLVLSEVPGFRDAWQRHLDYWEGEPAGLCNDMTAFSRYVSDLIAQGNTHDLPAIFNLIEKLMVEGDEQVKDAAATCFIENLLNRASSGAIDARTFAPLLGKESLAYARAWDEFSGARTPGVWE